MGKIFGNRKTEANLVKTEGFFGAISRSSTHCLNRLFVNRVNGSLVENLVYGLVCVHPISKNPNRISYLKQFGSGSDFPDV